MIFERLHSEWIYLAATVRLFHRLIPILRNPERTISDQIEDLARRFTSRPALMQDDRVLTFAELDAGATRIARWARRNGIGKGDVVGLMMHNRIEFIMAWMGIARAGGVTSLLNIHQVGRSLAHSISITGPRHVIVDAAFTDAYAEAAAMLDMPPAVWAFDGDLPGAERFEQAIATEDAGPLRDDERTALTTDDPCLYIFTSGTTGMPKAAKITHYRVLAAMNGFSSVMNPHKDDRVYVPLPLYHSTGGLIGVGAALTVGGATILKQRFSTGSFWKDCVTHDATMFVYIGEVCRYLVNAPACKEENEHKIRLICGNGLRPEVWRPLKERFGIPRIIEFYGATEGNVVIANHDGKEGAVGRIPRWSRPIFKTEIVKFDLDAEVPERDANGRCRRCRPGEIGEAIGRIERDAKKPTSRFDGYTNKAETDAKILTDVFETGDRWFRSGDLMRMDEAGYFYFVDRIGDTFRWKGENVATSEVGEALSRFDGVAEANAYGVRVPGRDGRAGMAMITPLDGELDFDALREHVAHQLPDYARPVFLRIADEIAKTSTFKQRKRELVEQGFDPAHTEDTLMYCDPNTGSYRPLDQVAYKGIVEGTIKL